MHTHKCMFSPSSCRRQWENEKQWITISHLRFDVCCQMFISQFWGKGKKEKPSGRWGSRWGSLGEEPPTPPNCRQQPQWQQDCCLLEAGRFAVLFRVLGFFNRYRPRHFQHSLVCIFWCWVCQGILQCMATEVIAFSCHFRRPERNRTCMESGLWERSPHCSPSYSLIYLATAKLSLLCQVKPFKSPSLIIILFSSRGQ